jgi:hypothetical protein
MGSTIRFYAVAILVGALVGWLQPIKPAAAARGYYDQLNWAPNQETANLWLADPRYETHVLSVVHDRYSQVVGVWLIRRQPR